MHKFGKTNAWSRFKEVSLKTVPIHKGKTLGKGWGNKIITKDIGVTIGEFDALK